MDDVYWRLLMGHLVGDYMLQSKLMATTKGQANNADGWLWCTLHCMIYSASVCVALWNSSLVLFCLVFLSHFFIDRFSLGGAWLKMTGGRTFESAILEDEPKRSFSIAFSCIMYAVVDNTMHLLLVWAIVVHMGL